MRQLTASPLRPRGFLSSINVCRPLLDFLTRFPTRPPQTHAANRSAPKGPMWFTARLSNLSVLLVRSGRASSAAPSSPTPFQDRSRLRSVLFTWKDESLHDLWSSAATIQSFLLVFLLKGEFYYISLKRKRLNSQSTPVTTKRSENF